MDDCTDASADENLGRVQRFVKRGAADENLGRVQRFDNGGTTSRGLRCAFACTLRWKTTPLKAPVQQMM